VRHRLLGTAGSPKAVAVCAWLQPLAFGTRERRAECSFLVRLEAVILLQEPREQYRQLSERHDNSVRFKPIIDVREARNIVQLEYLI